MEKAYNAKAHEQKIFKKWLENGSFHPNCGAGNITHHPTVADLHDDFDNAKKPNRTSKNQHVYTSIMPPPNINGAMHMGHTFQHTINDILIRYRRMRDGDALWLPGADHAGLEFQSTIEKKFFAKNDIDENIRELFPNILSHENIKKYEIHHGENKKSEKSRERHAREAATSAVSRGKSSGVGFSSIELDGKHIREDLGRENFVEICWIYVRKFWDNQKKQSQIIGDSADLSRKTFTLDPAPSRAVREHFCRLFEQNLIRRDAYIVQWCPRCNTAMTDLELSHADKNDKIYNFEYFTRDRKIVIPIATTRLETKLKDSCIAVNPNDKRYKNFIGKTFAFVTPAGEINEMPVIDDAEIDADFGSGAVGVTPAHSLVDYEIAKRHGLAMPQIIDKSGKMINVPDRFCGKTAKETRQILCEEMKTRGEKIEIEDFSHSVPVCERCKTVVEPLISEEWFVSMTPLAKKAIAKIETEEVKFHPVAFKKRGLDFLNKIHDWCISRQLWWGHPIPIAWCDSCKKDSKKWEEFVENYNEELKNNKISSGSASEISSDNSRETNFTRKIFSPPRFASPGIFAIREMGDAPSGDLPAKLLPKCPCCNGKTRSDPDVLDTWFSSGMWPLSTLGWPEEFEK